MIWVIISLAYFGLLAYLGSRLLPNNGFWVYSAGLLLSLAILALISGVIYRFFDLSLTTRWLILVIVPVLLAIAGYLAPNKSIAQPIPSEPKTISAWGVILLLLFVASATGSVLLLQQARTAESLRSPWPLTLPLFLIGVFICHLIALLLIIRRQTSQIIAWLIAFTTIGLSIFVVPIIYSVGYGFDPFIHQATVARILQYGSVSPKPFYYLGQYGLESLLVTISHLPLSLLDAWLLPILAFITIPTIIAYITDTKTFAFCVITITAFPLTWFINTTPQGIANLLLLAVILLSTLPLNDNKKNRRPLLIILALTALVVHPLAGLPALALLAFQEAWNSSQNIKKYTWAIMGAILLLILPAALFISTRGAATKTASIITTTLSSQSPAPFDFLHLQLHYNLLLDATYSYAVFLPVLITIIALFIANKHRRYATPLITMCALVAVIGAIVKFTIPATVLIDYEQTAYGDRLMILSLFFLLPLFILFLETAWGKIVKAPKSIQIFWIIFMAAVGTAGSYLTPPRFDSYAFDRGYSTSQYDILAVKKIDELANGQPYVVLANQAVSAAALREFGFAHYFPATTPNIEPLFYYPIPTGGPLYAEYLKMVYTKPEQKIIEDVRKLTGANLVFFVLNDYWFNSNTIKLQTATFAKSIIEIGEGRLTIFIFEN